MILFGSIGSLNCVLPSFITHHLNCQKFWKCKYQTILYLVNLQKSAFTQNDKGEWSRELYEQGLSLYALPLKNFSILAFTSEPRCTISSNFMQSKLTFICIRRNVFAALLYISYKKCSYMYVYIPAVCIQIGHTFKLVSNRIDLVFHFLSAHCLRFKAEKLIQEFKMVQSCQQIQR